MPYMKVKDGPMTCVHKENADGTAGSKMKCYDDEKDADAYIKALYAAMHGEAVKATGDWELEVLAVPFGVDSDGQIVDENTDFMLDTFSQPAVFYHHGINPGIRSIQTKPVIIGKTISMEKKDIGLVLRVVLDKAQNFAKLVWEAAQKGLVGVSSDSISHLARLQIAGKTMMYSKNVPGRIAVWPVAGISLWDRVPGNFVPASRNAMAVPAMKAIYQEAGIPFPDVGEGSTENDESEADKATRIARKNLQKQARRMMAGWQE